MCWPLPLESAAGDHAGTNPEYVTWVATGTVQTRVPHREELAESLGRFALTNSQLDAHVRWRAFAAASCSALTCTNIRRNPHSCRNHGTSGRSLADTILKYALNLSRQKIGQSLRLAAKSTDERGRISSADSGIVALESSVPGK